MFSSFNEVELYKENITSRSVIKAYALDIETMYLVVLNRISGKKTQKYFNIYDLNKKSNLISVKSDDKDIHGRFFSGYFTFIDGHFYFGNKVIKIRYDLITGQQTRSLNEPQVFDKYDSLIDLMKNETIQSQTPLLCTHYHRMIYFTRN